MLPKVKGDVTIFILNNVLVVLFAEFKLQMQRNSY